MSLGNLPLVIGKKPSLGNLNSLRWLFASWPIVGLPNVLSYSKFSTFYLICNYYGVITYGAEFMGSKRRRG
jgi:hypothetical protein